LSEIEGKEIEFFPHSLRHSRIECLLQGQDLRLLDENGKPKKFSLEQVQKMVNHSDPKTTQDYAKDHTDEEVDNMFGF
jgi:integrase